MADATKDYDLQARALRVLADENNQLSDDLRTLSEAIREIESLAAMLTDVKIRDAAAAGIEFCCRRAATRGAMQ